MEIWKPFKDTNYSVSTLSRVKNHKTGRVLKQYKRGSYKSVSLQVNLSKINYYVHRLVAEVHLPNTYNFTEVDHIDRDRANNNLDNLRWVSRKQNIENRLILPRKVLDQIIELHNQGFTNEEVYLKISSNH